MLSLKDQHRYNSSFNWILCIIIIIIITGCLLLQFPVEWEEKTNSPPVSELNKKNKKKQMKIQQSETAQTRWTLRSNGYVIKSPAQQFLYNL